MPLFSDYEIVNTYTPGANITLLQPFGRIFALVSDNEV